MRLGLSLIIFSFLIIVGCSKKISTTSGCNDSTGLTCPGAEEKAYCSSAISYSNSVTITGTAQYVRREPYSGGLGNASTSGTHPAKIYPIRYAEVQVLNGGAIAQCATTDASGNFSFQLPKNSSQSYTISVNSRASNSHLKASVLDKPATNAYYSLTKSVTANASKSVGTMTATASGTTLGGAFNILDQIAFANEYLRDKAGSCHSTNSGCTNFTTAPKINAYWVAGFNPNSYLGSSSSGLSFYLPGYSRLFILGGINGDMDSSDTDHFDNSVIIHEYGHFLEDSMFVSDSPGGSHNGNKVIDPRLAWSEGWGNFIQAAVTNWSGYNDPSYNYVNCQSVSDPACPTSPLYMDTLGNADGTTSVAFSVDLETPQGGDDEPLFDGEGNFREFSVTRFLWDLIDSGTENANSSSDNISDEFVQIWASLTKSSVSFKTSTYQFRNVGLLDLIHKNMAGSNTWANVQAVNMHHGDETDYARYVTTGTTCNYSITPASVAGDTGALSSSDLFRNNDFYHIKISSSGTYTVRLDYNDANSSGVVADLDLYVYNSSARFGNSNDIVGYSRQTPTQAPAVTQTESVSMSLTPGDYLINVNVYTGGALGGSVNYTLKLNGSQLCPSNLVPP